MTLLKKGLSPIVGGEADRMIEACDAHHTRLIINHTMRFHPNVRRAQRLVDVGVIGQLHAMVVFFDHWLLHMGSHLFDLMCFFAGEPKLVSGHIAGQDTIDTNGSGYVQFNRDVCALFSVGPKATRGYMELMGSDGLISIGNDINQTLRLWSLPRISVPAYPLPLEEQSFPGVPDEVERQGPRQGRYVTVHMIDEIVACIEDNRESISSGWNARSALEIAHAVYHSHRTGKMMTLPLSDRSLWIPEARPFEHPGESA